MTDNDVFAVIELYDEQMDKAVQEQDHDAIDRIGKAWHLFAEFQPRAYEFIR